jgi:hypothetical protein
MIGVVAGLCTVNKEGVFAGLCTVNTKQGICGLYLCTVNKEGVIVTIHQEGLVACCTR